MARLISVLDITLEEATELRRRMQASITPQRDSLRARIVLLRTEGKSQTEVAKILGISAVCVNKWSQRFKFKDIKGLQDRPRKGRPPSLSPEKVNQVIMQARQVSEGRSCWSTRSLAKALGGISSSSVQRILHAHQIKPHLSRSFKLSNDCQFEEKFWDIVGLYMAPLEKTLILCCDEKTQCQALGRTQPGLPLGIGHILTRTYDYVRHGTITLFAALNYLEGKLISRTEERHTHKEWLRFLKQIDRETPDDLQLHLVVDNYCTHKHSKVLNWLERHPRFHVHFTPTSSFWMNMVERFFADLSREVLRGGSFRSVKELVKKIESYLAERNRHPRAYKWHAKDEEVLAKIQRARKLWKPVRDKINGFMGQDTSSQRSGFDGACCALAIPVLMGHCRSGRDIRSRHNPHNKRHLHPHHSN